MNPEQLSDAMNELPQELLEETQAARSRRRPRWKPLAAAAACLLPELGKRAFAAQLGILSVLLGWRLWRRMVSRAARSSGNGKAAKSF